MVEDARGADVNRGRESGCRRINDSARMDVRGGTSTQLIEGVRLDRERDRCVYRNTSRTCATRCFKECDWRCNRRVTSPDRCSRAASQSRTLYEIDDLANGCVTCAFDVFSTAHRIRAAHSGAIESTASNAFSKCEQSVPIGGLAHTMPSAPACVQQPRFPASRRRRFEGSALLARHSQARGQSRRQHPHHYEPAADAAVTAPSKV
jgi:hypothetical protein